VRVRLVVLVDRRSDRDVVGPGRLRRRLRLRLRLRLCRLLGLPPLHVREHKGNPLAAVSPGCLPNRCIIN